MTLYDLDAAFDLAFVPGGVGFRGKEDGAVMAGKLDDFGVEVGVEPVGVFDRCLQVIDDQRFWNPAEMAEGVFEDPDEVLGSLAIYGLTVSAAGVRKCDAKHMGAAFLPVLDDPGARAKVDLGFVAGFALHAAKGKRGDGTQLSDKPFDGGVGSGKSFFRGQILKDPLGRQAVFQFVFYEVLKRFALAGSTGRKTRIRRDQSCEK